MPPLILGATAAAGLAAFLVAFAGVGAGCLLLAEAALAAGCVVVGGTWLARGMQAPYGMSGAAFLGLGLFLPLAQMIFLWWLPDLWWLSAASLGGLYLHGRSSARSWEERRRFFWEGKLAEAEEAVQSHPGNATAHCQMARAHDEAGRWELALECYRRARDARSPTYPEAAYAADEKKAEAAMAERAAAGPRAAARREWLERGWLPALAFCLPILLWDARRFAAVYPACLFALWCLRAPEE